MADSSSALPLALVSPEGVLHLVPAENKAKAAFCEAHGLRVAYLNYHIAGNKKYDSGHGGWSLLHRVQWVQHTSGAVVPVIGSPKHFFNNRAAICERAELDESAMPFAEHEVRQFQRFLDPEDKSVTVFYEWRVVDMPVRVLEAECRSQCSVCLCPTANLFTLLNSTEVPSEVTSGQRR